MAKPFDTTLNDLIDLGPADWVALLAPKAGLAPARPSRWTPSCR